MGDPIFSPDSGLSSNSDESRPSIFSHRSRKQELKVLEDVEEMEPIVVEEPLDESVTMERFFADSVDDYMAQEEIVLSEDADSVGEFVLTDRSNNCFEEFMQIEENSARGNGLESSSGSAHDPLSKLLADSGLQYYPPPAAGPSAEEELRMLALMNTTEPVPEEQASHFVRRSLRKRSVRHEELVDEDSEDESPPRRKGGRSKTRRPRKSWSRRPRSQPPDDRAGPSHQQHQSPLQRGPRQQLFLQQNQFPQQQSQEPQQFQQLTPHQQHQFRQQQLLQVSQQFHQQRQSHVPQQHHSLPQQIPQQHQFTQLQQPQMPQQQPTHQEQQQQMAPPPPPQHLQQTLPESAVMDSREMLLSCWNSFMFDYIRKLPKDKLRYLDARLNDRLLGKLPPIQREPGWLEEMLRD